MASVGTREVHHTFPTKDADYDWPFEDEEGGRTTHDFDVDPENCWCCPTVMELQEVDGRVQWVTVIEGKTAKQLIADSRPQEDNDA